MKRWDTVAIVGVGLLGGSIGLALRQRKLANQVVGIGRHAGRLRRARQARRGDGDDDKPGGVAHAKLIIVCTPVEYIVDHVCQAAAACPDGALLTDVGSTKESIVTALETPLREAKKRGIAFVGSHPMAGSEQSSVEYAQADFFAGRITIVTPSRRTRRQDGQAVEQFWESLGSHVVRRSPREHDRAVSAISHLPHLVASAMAAATAEGDLPLAGSGWQDTTRVAAADVELWRQILLDNRSHVLKSLDKFEKVLASFRGALEKNHRARLVQLLATGKRNRDAVGN